MNNNTLTFIFFLTGVGIIFFFAWRERSLLKKDFQKTIAVITGVKNFKNSGGRTFLKYSFTVEGKSYRSNESISCDERPDVIFEYLRQKNVTAIYQTTDPTNSTILVTVRNFEEYGLIMTKNDSILVAGLKAICNN
jgi:hypothetical protein